METGAYVSEFMCSFFLQRSPDLIPLESATGQANRGLALISKAKHAI